MTSSTESSRYGRSRSSRSAAVTMRWRAVSRRVRAASRRALVGRLDIPNEAWHICDTKCDTASQLPEPSMNPFSVSVSTTVPAPPAEVQELLDDLGAHPQWTDHFLVDWE